MNVVGKARTTVAANADNATATAALAAAGTGFKWLVKAWGAGFSPGGPAATVTATLTVGSTVVTFPVGATSPWQRDLGADGYESEENGAPSIALAASGTAGQIGRVYIEAIKVPASFTY